MKDIKIIINKSTRMVKLSKTMIGNDGENLQSNFVFEFEDEFVNGQARLEYIIDSETKYVFLDRDGETYTTPVKSFLTKKGTINMQLVILEGTNEENVPIFKSNMFYVFCNSSINAEVEEPEITADWFEIANTKLNQIDNLDIDIEDSIITITKKDGTVKTENVKGDKGDKGDVGPTGPQGEVGPQGPIGPKGDDYVITDEDMQEIINLLPNAIATFIMEHSVSSSQAQNLTENQKALARSNINAGEDLGTWELLYTIEGSDDNVNNDIRVWEFTEFADGTPLQLRAVSAKIINNIAVNANTYGFLYAYDNQGNTINAAVITKFLSTTSNSIALGVVEQDKGYYKGYAVEGASRNPGAVRESAFQQYNKSGSVAINPYIAKIRVSHQETAHLMTGNSIEVWGVRA